MADFQGEGVIVHCVDVMFTVLHLGVSRYLYGDSASGARFTRLGPFIVLLLVDHSDTPDNDTM